MSRCDLHHWSPKEAHAYIQRGELPLQTARRKNESPPLIYRSQARTTSQDRPQARTALQAGSQKLLAVAGYRKELGAAGAAVAAGACRFV